MSRKFSSSKHIRYMKTGVNLSMVKYLFTRNFPFLLMIKQRRTKRDKYVFVKFEQIYFQRFHVDSESEELRNQKFAN